MTKFAVDLPNPHDVEAPFINVGIFDTKEEAVNYIRLFLCSDSEGFVNLITELVEDSEN